MTRFQLLTRTYRYFYLCVLYIYIHIYGDLVGVRGSKFEAKWSEARSESEGQRKEKRSESEAKRSESDGLGWLSDWAAD